MQTAFIFGEFSFTLYAVKVKKSFKGSLYKYKSNSLDLFDKSEPDGVVNEFIIEGGLIGVGSALMFYI